MKIAIHTDWLTVRGGAEKVIFDILKIFPEADIFTTIFNPENFPEFKDKKVATTYLQKIPKFLRKHTLLMPFYPKAVESLDFTGYDLVIGSSSNATKGIITNPETTYICYCHTPVRALWSEHRMFASDPRYKFIPNFILNRLLHKLRIADWCAAQRVDHFISNANFIGERIKKFYGRESKTIYPNCSIKIPENYKKEKGEYFFVNSRLVPTKKNELLVKAFNQMPDKKLKILGQGAQFDYLKSIAKENIELIKVNEETFLEDRKRLMSKAIAFMHPQLEDFGITPLEAQAFGVPLIAYGKGGVLETVIEGKTGEFFSEQTEESLIEAVRKFDLSNYKNEDLIENAEKFNFENFKKELLDFVGQIRDNK